MANLLPDFDRLEETMNARDRISQQDAELQQRVAESLNTRHRLSQQDTQLRQREGAEVLKIRNIQAAQIADMVAMMQRDAAISGNESRAFRAEMRAFREESRTESRAFRAEMAEMRAFREESRNESRAFREEMAEMRAFREESRNESRAFRAEMAEMRAFREESRNESRAFRAEMGAFREETGVNLVNLGRLMAARDWNVYARLENSGVRDFSMAFSVLRCLKDIPELEVVTNQPIPGFPENGRVLVNMHRPRLLVCLEALEILFVEDDTTSALKRRFRLNIGVRRDIEED